MNSTSTEYAFDLIVIGSGPGGEGAAMQAVKQGRRVAVVERFSQIGGGCTHWGTIPSKSLRFSIFQMTEANANPLFREAGVHLNLSFAELRKRAESVISHQVEMRNGFYVRNNVPVLHGSGRLIDEHTVELEDPSGKVKRLTTAGIIIAAGSRPYRSPDVDFSHPRIFDSDTILTLEQTPRSITVYGAGVVGCEYASMFRNLGCKVDLVNSRDRLLDFLDDEITDALSYHLRDRGMIIRHREEYSCVEGTKNGVILQLKSGKKIHSDCLLWASGRTGNSDRLGLENVGLVPNQRGQLDVNEDFQTKIPSIYAVGDIIGFPALASAAYVQGRYAALHVLTGQCDRSLVREIPTGIYTSPEISSVGKTERQLTEAHIPYEVGHAQFKHLARAQITGRNVGMLKLLFHRETLEILGVHCFGDNAAEIVHIGQAIMSQPGQANSLLYFINTTFNYPTMAEAYRVAAFNGYNRVR
ncbi:MAG: Si-specific NAD(P)(+) transhydrogenase [Planctomycetota bacterium]|nr:Si-specific NAD(P)(+) transhydrogenase [Planctomycetota bacterium]MDA1212836.1 Si-specific NAD(P)(+) transhydrogenase [Planctomycetota bacterium]